MTPSANIGVTDAEIAQLKDAAHERWLDRRSKTKAERHDHAAWSKNGLPKTYDIDETDAKVINTVTIPG